MSKLSFRARALDASKPLPVFRCEDLPDLHEYASINRAVPQMPTGMEKEEESEHHLQRAISAQQVWGEKRDNMVIPVPEAECNIPHYESLYPGEFKMPKQLIHIQPFSLDTEKPDYDLDSEDALFVKEKEITELQFEEMIDRLEKGSGQQLVSLQEAKLLLKEDDELIKEVFEYWSHKRKNSGALIPAVKQEKRDSSSTSDPYVAFRRRTEKMQTRKNRKNDEVSYEKMLKLRRDLSRAVTILEMIKRREKSKRELLHLTLEIVEKRNAMPDLGAEVMAEALAQRALVKPVYTIPLLPLSNSQYRHPDLNELKDYKKPEKTEPVRTKRKYEKKPKIPVSAAHHSGPAFFSPKDLNQYDFPSSDDEYSQIVSGSSEAEEETDPDGNFAFRRKSGCHYYASRPEQSGNWPWMSPTEGGLGDPRFRFCLTSLNAPRRCVGLARRRVGRGGRILLDRAHSDLDPGLDLASVSPLDSPLHRRSTSDNHTSDLSSPLPPPSSKTPVDLSQILLNIKSCRWRHFRPRTVSQYAPGSGGLCRGGFRDLSRTVSGLTRTLSAQTRTGPGQLPVNVFTVEQYQHHQEQVALMQRQQLEQSQLQQQQTTATTAPQPTKTQTNSSKTLDQASAQFAASALVMSEQLGTYKSKDEILLNTGVNGVLTNAGVFKGLHLSSAPSAPQPFLQPNSSSPSQPPSTPHPTAAAAALGLLGNAAPSTTQVLIGNNLCLSVPTSRHLPRALATVPASALKLSSNANLPSLPNLPNLPSLPKVSSSQSMDMAAR
ncbi:enhancer of polycomb homolog 1-like isoform X2 [Periophthalmus magnuspinnatus]|nr:enhancer of polycomb homolog 1-like isoform X2 [Periophthalmus magnuspinnatus]